MIYKKSAALLMLATSFFFVGCSAVSVPSGTQAQLQVAPVVPSYEKEITLAKLNEVLSMMELTPEQRARFLYERGVLHDSLGLKVMARIDFHQALKINPQLADAYNFLGIYFTQLDEFEKAYEAFDGVLELAPNYDYAFLNRGIALYYGNKTDLALEDVDQFYRLNPADGYRVLWRYIVARKKDQLAAKQALMTQRQQLNDQDWATAMVDYYLGELTQAQLLAQAKSGAKNHLDYAQRLCEAYFYLAKDEMALGNYQAAANYLRLTLATNIYDFVEHRYAQQELVKVEQLLKKAKS